MASAGSRRQGSKPLHPEAVRVIHWSFADPAGAADVHAAFRRVAAGLRTRIGFLLARTGE